MICEITHIKLIAVATKIKKTNRCTDIAILALEQPVQTVAAHAPHSYAQCFQFWLELKALVVANGMLVFWIIINPADLQYPFVIRFAGIELELSSKIQSDFWRKTAIINSFAVAKFFYIICNAIFLSLFGVGQKIRGLLGPISNYFGIVEINTCEILHLHCFVWLKGVLHFVILQTQLQSNNKFREKLLLFLEHIIKCSASQNLHLQTLDQACPNANDPITTQQFIDLLRSNSEAVAQKV